MDLLPTSDQQQIADAAAAFAADRLPLRRVHGKTGAPDLIADELWAEIAQMGWLGVGLAETAGGSGLSVVEEMLVFWRLGRELAPPEILFSALGARVAARAGDAAMAARLAAGELKVALALQDDFAGAAEALTRRRVFGFQGAALALAADGTRLRLLNLKDANLTPGESLDLSVSMALADLESVEVVADVTGADIAVTASLLCAATLLGIAEVSMEMTVAYAKIRHTFGRPIGAYQAVRHPCADMAARAERAKAQLFMAAASLAEGGKDAQLMAASARLLCEDSAIANTDAAIQLHGGIGVTDEFDTHLLLKRALVSRAWFGDRRSHLARILAEGAH